MKQAKVLLQACLDGPTPRSNAWLLNKKRYSCTVFEARERRLYTNPRCHYGVLPVCPMRDVSRSRHTRPEHIASVSLPDLLTRPIKGRMCSRMRGTKIHTKHASSTAFFTSRTVARSPGPYRHRDHRRDRLLLKPSIHYEALSSTPLLHLKWLLDNSHCREMEVPTSQPGAGNAPFKTPV